jgi:hypothetical protein
MVSEHIVGVRAGPPFTDIMVPRASSFAATSTRIKIKGGRWWKAKKKAQKSRLSRRVILAVIDPKTLQSMQATNDACASNQVFSTNHPR